MSATKLPATDEDWAKYIEEVEESVQEIAKSGSPDAFEDVRKCPPENVAQYIDHTQLKTDATTDQIDQLCSEAQEYGFKTVCVRLPHVPRALSNIATSPSSLTPFVGIACVIGFPEGTYTTQEKCDEAHVAVKAGASELDVVLNYPLLSSTEGRCAAYTAIVEELMAINKIRGKVPIKAIIETSQLDRSQIVAACCLTHGAGADFVKTSTGFKGHGARVEDVLLMKRVVAFLDKREGRGRQTEVKASGGIRSWEDAQKMIRAGATRIGASSGVAIVKEAREGTKQGKVNGGDEY